MPLDFEEHVPFYPYLEKPAESIKAVFVPSDIVSHDASAL